MIINTKTLGDIGEYCVMSELAKHGIGVAPTLSDNYPFDFIAITDKKLFKIQVKSTTRNYNNESVCFGLVTSYYCSGTVKTYTKKDCDVIICYDLVTNKAFLLSDFENKTNFTIRYTPAKNNIKNGVNWEKDYIISPKRIKEVFNYDVPDFGVHFSYADRREYDLVCSVCGKKFLSAYKKKKFCSSECIDINKRKVPKVSKDELIAKIKELPLTVIGKYYGVSDNAVRKWAKNYKINVKKLKSKSKL